MPNAGNNPCTELKTRAGTWRYDANRLDQHFARRALRHGSAQRRGDLLDRRADLATQHAGPTRAELAQALHIEAERQPAGRGVGPTAARRRFCWPECYYDDAQKKLVLAPEYGGDGGKAVGVCAQKEVPIAAFPAHWAPNAMLTHEGSQFPTAYKDGAFIAFHGS
jgi:hypothetical protein